MRTLQNYRDAMMSASGSSEEARLAVARWVDPAPPTPARPLTGGGPAPSFRPCGHSYYVQIDNAAARFPVNESNVRPQLRGQESARRCRP